MFTGIIEELGEVTALRTPAAGAVLQIRCRQVAESLSHGASVAVDGVCLTVVRSTVADGDTCLLDFDVMGETLRRSTIGVRQPGDAVNLERPVRADGRLDGHIVQGHVDGVAAVLSRTPGPAWESVRFSVPPNLARYVAEKGSITVNGVSLTVSAVGTGADPVPDPDSAAATGPVDADGDWFEVGLIPETLRATNLGRATPGTRVNLEVDVLAKYTERLLERRAPAVAP